MNTKPEIEQLLTNTADALGRGDASAVAELWEVPALVLSEQGAVPVAARAEVESFFTSAIADYRSRGLFGVRPKLLACTQLSASLYAVNVRWQSLDVAGVEEGSSEESHYILQRCADGQYRFRVALSRNQG
jgi:hypothetical protein